MPAVKVVMMRRGRKWLVAGLLATTVAVPQWTVPQEGSAQLPPDEPGPATAQAEAVRTGRRVELPEARTETGEVFANPDGSKTLVQHAVPVRVRRGAGWVAPDPTLRRGADGTVRPVATVSPMVLSGGGDAALLTIGSAGAQVRIGWPGGLPAPRLDGPTATYPEVLPGVDLRITVGVDDFSHVLVVKDRAAALNPALRTLRYPVGADGLSLTVRKDGTMIAADRSGKPVYTAGSAMMWDGARQARVGLALAGRELVLTPDRAMLTDPAARFPILIDPSLSGWQYRWTHVNRLHPEQPYWNYDRAEGAKVGYAWDCSGNMYRSLFQVRTSNGAQTIAGSRILNATFRITLDHSPTGTATPVQLWHTAEIDPAVSLTWNNSGGHWRQHLADTSVEAYPPPEDKGAEFGGAALKAVVQAAADQRLGQLAFGLRAPDERAYCGSQTGPPRNQWKKFRPETAVLVIDYNTAPRVPKGLTMTQPKPCGTAAAPTPIPSATPQFAAVANDPDAGDTVTTTLQIRNAAGTVVHSGNVGPTVSGAAFSWPRTPAGVLQPGVPYRYSAFTTDLAGAVGPSTPECHFVVDVVRPSTPVIQSTDYPDGEPVIGVLTAGRVTFRPGSAADTDVGEYVYGFQPDVMTMRVKAGPDGTATVPVTLQPGPDGTEGSGRLFVRAADRAGNLSLNYRSWQLYANPTGARPSGIRADANGDGKADVTAVFDHGFGRTAIWNLASTGAGFHTGVIGWDAGTNGGYPLYRTKPVQGDFNGDGLADIAMFNEGAGRKVWLFTMISDGNRYHAPPFSWESPANSWPLSTARVIAADVDADGKDDIVVQTAGGADNWQALVFTAATGFGQPVSWATATAGNPWAGSAPLLADVDGDAKADLLSVRNLTGCRTAVDLYRSTGTAFAAAGTIYDSGAGGHCWEKSEFAIADADGDGRDDVVALYENAPTDAGLFVFRSTGTTLTRAGWGGSTGLDLSKATLTTGDFDGDGLDDAGLLYAVAADRQVYTFRSTGTAFGARVLGWDGQVGAVTGPKFDIEHRQYELVNRNSGKCLQVDGSGLERPFVQRPCQAVNLAARFRLTPIAGTEQYSVRPVHSADTPATGTGILCADVDEMYTHDDVPVITWKCGQGVGEPTANQQVTLEYVEGSAYDTVVQLRFAHSGKCAQVRGGSTADAAPVVQMACGLGSDQQWILRPAFNAGQLGGTGGAARYRVESALGPTVLDVVDCGTNPASVDVRMWHWVAGSPCQKWQLKAGGDDVYALVDPHTGKAVDITGCSQLPEVPVVIFDANAGECQRWRIEPSPGGTYSVIAVTSGLSLDVDNCDPAAGANVITWFYWGGPCQRWLFKPQ